MFAAAPKYRGTARSRRMMSEDGVAEGADDAAVDGAALAGTLSRNDSRPNVSDIGPILWQI